MATLTLATRRRRARRMLSALLIGAVSLIPAAAQAREEDSASRLKDGVDHIQQELDDSVARIEALRSRQSTLLFEVSQFEQQSREVEAAKRAVEVRAVEVARWLYMNDDSETLEALLSADSFAELSSRYEAMAQITELDRVAFTDLKHLERQLRRLQDELSTKTEELARARSRLEDESTLLQARLREATAEYEKKQAELADERGAAPTQAGVVTSSGLACPIAAPNSFIDSWGFPRSGGRTHEGTDMMATSGAPVVAITDGRITFEGYGTTAGNWLILSGDDGNSYWYMHNRENLISAGRVRAGEQIATVGDTGNAIGGPPHVHFEYHPGGGGPVNPYPLLSKVCRGAA